MTTHAWKIAFKEMADAEMPRIPLGFTDISFRNDACPSFEREDCGLHIWVNFADPAQREAGGARFIVSDGDASKGRSEVIATEDWETAQVYLIGYIFARTVKAGLTVDEYAQMRRDNASNVAGVCASHDFFDANMIMDDAFSDVKGRSCVGDHGVSEADAETWNRAWEIARDVWAKDNG